MNKKEIKNKIKEAKEQIKDLQETVNNLEEQLNKLESRWKPEENERYYYIAPDGEVIRSYNDKSTSCRNRISIGNCFKIEKEAEFEVERLKVIAELKDFSFEPDWKIRGYRDKYVLAYNHYSEEIVYCTDTWRQRDNIYFETEADVKNAIEQVGEDRILKFLFGVRE